MGAFFGVSAFDVSADAALEIAAAAMIPFVASRLVGMTPPRNSAPLPKRHLEQHKNILR
jgi:hypothetical protein